MPRLNRYFRICTLLLIATCPFSLADEPKGLVLPPDPVTRQELLAEIDIKMNRVQNFLREQHLAGILLTRVNNFSWMTAGIADNEIVITSEVGAASLLVMNDGHKYVVGENGEVSRHAQEDLAGLNYESKGYDWYRDQTVPDRKLEIIHELARGALLGVFENATGARFARLARPAFLRRGFEEFLDLLGSARLADEGRGGRRAR